MAVDVQVGMRGGEMEDSYLESVIDCFSSLNFVWVNTC